MLTYKWMVIKTFKILILIKGTCFLIFIYYNHIAILKNPPNAALIIYNINIFMAYTGMLLLDQVYFSTESILNFIFFINSL